MDLARFFGMTTYRSEFSIFMAEFHKKYPELQAEQQAGRQLLWDKAPLDLDEQRQNHVAEVDAQRRGH